MVQEHPEHQQLTNNKEIKHEIICKYSSGFIQSTLIYITIFLCDSGIGKHLKIETLRFLCLNERNINTRRNLRSRFNLARKFATKRHYSPGIDLLVFHARSWS